MASGPVACSVSGGRPRRRWKILSEEQSRSNEEGDECKSIGSKRTGTVPIKHEVKNLFTYM